MDREKITIQLDADVLEKLNLYAKLDNKTQNDFINNILDNALNNYFLMLTGGMVLTVPNPQHYHIDKNKALEKLSLIKQVADECNSANIPTGIYALANYLKARIFDDSESQRELFKSNLENIKR
jgi:hypothetical protein